MPKKKGKAPPFLAKKDGDMPMEMPESHKHMTPAAHKKAMKKGMKR